MQVVDWNSIQAEEARPGVYRKGFSTQNVMLVYHDLHPGMETKPHSHDFEQVVYVIDGKGIFWVGGRQHAVFGGCVFCIPPNVDHYIEVRGDEVVRTIDVFHPPRSDYLHLVAHQEA